MQRDFRDLSESAVYELISYAPMSPRLMRIQLKFVKLIHSYVFMTKLSSIICLATCCTLKHITFLSVMFLAMLSLTEIFLHPGDLILTCSNHNFLFKL